MAKYKYFIRSLLRLNTEKICPYCSNEKSKVIDRKFFVTTLNECSNCFLYFRHPYDTIDFNRKFYQKEYKQKNGITIGLPTDEELSLLLANNFIGTARDYSHKIEILKRLVSNSVPKLIDYGANWGYTSFQFLKAGFEVQSYEISKPRAGFGKKLGINIYTDENFLKGNIDLFFSSHVIEHIPDIKRMFILAQKLLNKNGYFVAYCPNGSNDFKLQKPREFHRLWGQVHPNYLNAKFFSTVFRDIPYLIGSDLAEAREILEWDKDSQKILNISGSELFVFAKLKDQLI